MIPNDQVPKVEQVVSGGGVTEISFPFYVVDSATVYVLVDGVPVSSGWHVELNSYVPESEGEEDPEEPVSSEYEVETGRVVFDSAVVAGATVTVYRSTPMTQDVELGQGSSFYPQVIEEALDKVVMGMQELRGGTVNTPGTVLASAAFASNASHASSADFASTANYANSAGLASSLVSNFVVNSAVHATTAAGLDAGVVVSSATYATYASSAVTANGAAFANAAMIASGLTDAAKVDIINSAGGGGGGSGVPYILYNAGANVYVEGSAGASYDYTTSGTSDGTHTVCGTGLGGVILGYITAPSGATDNWETNFIVSFNGSAATTHTVLKAQDIGGGDYTPAGALVCIPVGPITDFKFTAYDSAGTPEGSLMFYPYATHS